MSSTFLVTGASGQLGRRVLQLLLDRRAGRVIATTRHPSALADFAARGVDVREASFDDPAGLPRAFAGADRALLISTDALDRPGRRFEQHEAAIAALVSAGVKHVAYTSFVNPRPDSAVLVSEDHRRTEASLADTTLGHTFLRNNLYTDFLPMSLASAVKSGQLVDAKGEGKISYVTREDCAQIAAAALADGFDGRRALAVTGPEAIGGAALAALVSELSGKTITHVSVPAEALIQGMVSHGLPEPVARVLASFDVGAQRGEMSVVDDAVLRLTARRPQSVREYLQANRSAWLP